MALAQAKKTGIKILPKSALLAQALQQVSKLSGKRQDAIGAQLLEMLDDQPDPASARFQELIELKYTRGLTALEVAELQQLEAMFEKREEPFYRPILKRIAQLPDLAEDRRTTRSREPQAELTRPR